MLIAFVFEVAITCVNIAFIPICGLNLLLTEQPIVFTALLDIFLKSVDAWAGALALDGIRGTVAVVAALTSFACERLIVLAQLRLLGMHAEGRLTEPCWHSNRSIVFLAHHLVVRTFWALSRVEIYMADGALAAAASQLARGLPSHI